MSEYTKEHIMTIGFTFKYNGGMYRTVTPIGKRPLSVYGDIVWCEQPRYSDGQWEDCGYFQVSSVVYGLNNPDELDFVPVDKVPSPPIEPITMDERLFDL